jgi:hypothetical protein
MRRPRRSHTNVYRAKALETMHVRDASARSHVRKICDSVPLAADMTVVAPAPSPGTIAIALHE